MKIIYEAESFTFAHFPALKKSGHLSIKWQDLVLSAITTGKRHPFYWAHHPFHSLAEEISRTWNLYSILKTSKSNHLEKSDLYDKTMDPTEKVGASYFIGMTTAKLVAEQLLDTPWIFHTSSAAETILTKPGKSLPDLIGYSNSLNWIILEAKGRTGAFERAALSKAKDQAEQILTINGKAPICRAGIQSYFDSDLRIKMKDPPASNNAIPIKVNIPEALSRYYSIRHLIHNQGAEKKIRGRDYIILDEPNTGIKIGLPKILVNPEFTLESSTLSRHDIFPAASIDINERAKISRDGFYIELGDSWSDMKMKLNPMERSK